MGSLNGHSYYLSDNSIAANWDGAFAVAESQGGYLASITSAEENAFIDNFSDSTISPLIGLSDFDVNGVFVWHSGEPYLYSNWIPGEPTGGVPTTHEYVHIQLANGGWNDVGDLFGPYQFIVEVEDADEDGLANALDFTSIPDVNFEQALMDLGYDASGILDGCINTAELAGISRLDISHKGIADLTGIQDFTSLEYLYHEGNALDNPNLVDNENLVYVKGGGFSLELGDSYAGGIIFYLDASGQHGLVAALNDQDYLGDFNRTWGCVGTTIGGTSIAVGSGQANTTEIINECGEVGIAARICDDYSVTANGVFYDDWFLPSKDELHLMYSNLWLAGNIGLGGFVYSVYWSSSEFSNNTAWNEYFLNGQQYDTSKGQLSRRTRAVRAF